MSILNSSKSVALFASASVAMLCCASPAAAQDAPSQTATAEEDTPAPEADEGQQTRECRTITRTGTRFSRRVCRTRGEWREGEMQTQEVTDDYRRRNNDPASRFESQNGPSSNQSPNPQ